MPCEGEVGMTNVTSQTVKNCELLWQDCDKYDMTLCELRPLLEPGSMKSAGLCQKSRWALCKYGDSMPPVYTTCCSPASACIPFRQLSMPLITFFKERVCPNTMQLGWSCWSLLYWSLTEFLSLHSTGPKSSSRKIRGPGIMRSLQIANISEHRLVLLLWFPLFFRKSSTSCNILRHLVTSCDILQLQNPSSVEGVGTKALLWAWRNVRLGAVLRICCAHHLGHS